MAADRPPTNRRETENVKSLAMLRAEHAILDCGVSMSSEARSLLTDAIVQRMILMWHDGKLEGVRDMTDRILAR